MMVMEQFAMTAIQVPILLAAQTSRCMSLIYWVLTRVCPVQGRLGQGGRQRSSDGSSEADEGHPVSTERKKEIKRGEYR